MKNIDKLQNCKREKKNYTSRKEKHMNERKSKNKYKKIRRELLKYLIPEPFEKCD